MGTFTAAATFSCVYVLEKGIGLRVASEHEIEGLDKSEHKDVSYMYHHNPVAETTEEETVTVNSTTHMT